MVSVRFTLSFQVELGKKSNLRQLRAEHKTETQRPSKPPLAKDDLDWQKKCHPPFVLQKRIGSDSWHCYDTALDASVARVIKPRS